MVCEHLQRNYQARVGEIDLIMLDGETLVFAEVRFRKHETMVAAQTASPGQATANHPRRSPFSCLSPRHVTYLHAFDVISIGIREGRTLFDWIQNAFDAS